MDRRRRAEQLSGSSERAGVTSESEASRWSGPCPPLERALAREWNAAGLDREPFAAGSRSYDLFGWMNNIRENCCAACMRYQVIAAT